MKKKQIKEINITRAIAILGVLLVHVTSFPVSVYDTSSSVYGVYNFSNIFFKFGTPTFIFLSSFVLFYSYYHRPLNKSLITNFYKKRLLYIIMPYVIFSLIYYMYNAPYYTTVMSNSEMTIDFLKKLATGEVFAHLYFVFISIQFYVLFPVLLYFFKRFKGLVKHAVWIGILVQWLFVLINHYYLGLTNKGSISFSYFSYYFLGIYAGIYYDQIIDFLTIKKHELMKTRFGLLTLLIWSSWLIASLAHVYVWYTTRTTGAWAPNLIYELLWNVHTYLSAIILLQVSYVIYRRLSNSFVNVLIHLGTYSFGVYLVHLLILNLYERLIPPFGTPLLYHIKYIAGFIVTLMISWLIVSLLSSRFKYSWILFGATPKKIPYKEKQSYTTDESDTKSVI
ncbi:acyltransferase [Oceanobacillus halotolerans]|uniref:acyltransferase n=1 Tax=Oceanobacillus halotolerans TaxID=2663380 RepID=UPI0013DB0FD7|nr:acyltransferase [Oceanobacillus halotolerans]